MALFGNRKRQESVEEGKKVVATGKRVRGVWTMESSLRPRARRNAADPSVLVAENRRVRTLH